MMELLVAMGTLVIAVFTGLVWKINKRMEWLTGAMESHSDIMLRLEAHKQGIPMELWDKSVDPFPRQYGHKEPYKLEKIYIGVHPALRKEPPPSTCYQIGTLFSGLRNWRDCWDDFQEGRKSEDNPE